jgi:hypothetical protein
LNLGYDDFSRLPDQRDGVFFSRPLEEGKPGMQPERIPPYVTTLNPGWDPKLPLYKPLPMFFAQKAALATDGPQPCPWQRRPEAARPARPALSPGIVPKGTVPFSSDENRDSPPRIPGIEQVAFFGDRAGALAKRLTAWGVPLALPKGTPLLKGDARAGLAVVDAETLTVSGLAEVKSALDRVRDARGIVLVFLGPDKARLQALESLFPAFVRLTDRRATALVPDAEHPWVAPFSLPSLYFAEDGANRFILQHGLEGPLAERVRVLLKASDTDWSMFNDAGENAKCAATVLYEHLAKPGGAALLECEIGQGKLVLSTLDWRVTSRAADEFWRKLLANMGVGLRDPREGAVEAFDEEHSLVNALTIGRFGAESVDAALKRDFIGEKSAKPKKGTTSGDSTWTAVSSPGKDRFVLRDLHQDGPKDAFAVYFSYSIRSPRALDDLLGGGPDAPRFTTLAYVSEKCKLFLNGEELVATRTEPADYRTLCVYEGVPLKKGWNHFLVKVASGRLEGDAPATLAVRIQSTHEDYLGQLDSAIGGNHETRDASTR